MKNQMLHFTIFKKSLDSTRDIFFLTFNLTILSRFAALHTILSWSGMAWFFV